MISCPPHPRANTQLPLAHQARVHDRPEALRLPVERRDGADLVTRNFPDRLRGRQPDVARAERPFQPPGDGVLVSPQHHQGTLARRSLEDERFHHLRLGESKSMSHVGRTLLGGRRKFQPSMGNPAVFQVFVRRQIHGEMAPGPISGSETRGKRGPGGLRR